MADRSSNIQQQVAVVFQRLSLTQKVMFGAVGIGVMVGIYMLVSLVNTPSYTTLFSNLSAEDASKIVDEAQRERSAVSPGQRWQIRPCSTGECL